MDGSTAIGFDDGYVMLRKNSSYRIVDQQKGTIVARGRWQAMVKYWAENISSKAKLHRRMLTTKELRAL